MGAAALALIALAPACAQSPEEPAVAAALDQTLDALRRADFDALWNLTAPDAQAALLAMLAHQREALAAVPRVYGAQGEQTMATARAALGETIFESVFPEDPKAGPKLLARLLAPDALNFDEHAVDGLSSRDITVDEKARPVTAVVHTSGGEKFAFVRTDAGWRSLLVRDLLLDNPIVRALDDAAKKVLAASAGVDAQWRVSRDPTEPQGAYNLARHALENPARNAPVLYSLLGEDARAVLLQALQRSREAQRDIQRKTTRKQRKKAYGDVGLDIYVEARSDRDLFARWAQSKSYVALMGATDEPVNVEIAPDAPGKATVVTKGGGRVPFEKGPDGVWRLSGLAPLMTTALLEPVQALTAP